MWCTQRPQLYERKKLKLQSYKFKITKVSKTLPQNNSETFTNEHDEIPKGRYISPEERQKIIDDLKLISQYNNGMIN